MVLLRRIYGAPEMFQLLATFALVLVFNDLALWPWGPADLLGPLAPGLHGALQIFDRYLPVYDLLLIVIGPAVLLALWLLLPRTPWGPLLRAAAQARAILAATAVTPARPLPALVAPVSLLAPPGGT